MNIDRNNVDVVEDNSSDFEYWNWGVYFWGLKS